MTTIDRFDPFERRITEAIVEIAAERRPDYLDSVFQVTARSRQRPRWTLPERWLHVNRMTLTAAAVAVVLLVGGGAYLLTRFTSPDTGGPPTPGTSPSPTPGAAVVAMPDLVWGDWHAANVTIPGSSTPHLVRLSLSWQDGRSGWIQVDDAGFQQIFPFYSIEAPAGEIDIRASNTVGCAVGDVGRYRWSRSADGLFLTLQVIEDACPNRATAFARTWVHSLSAVTDGGLGIIPFDPWIQITVPKQKMGMGGGTDAPELKTFGDAEPFRAFVAVKDPGGFKAPCSAGDKQPTSITETTLAFEAYVRALPGASVTASSTFVAGVAATRLDVRIDPAVDCAGGDVAAFLPLDLNTDVAWSFSPGEVQTLYILQTALASQDSQSGSNAGETVLVWYQGPSGEEQGVIDSMTFLDQLPTP